MIQKLLILIFITSLTLHSNEKKTYIFAPLPTKNISQNIKDFIPLFSYLENKLNINIKYKHLNNYQDILKGFENGTIDIAYLGPLPFISLYKKYKYAKPIISFNNQNNQNKYRCVLAKFKEDKLDTSKKIKVALTQPLSTCGYFLSSILLKKQLNIDLKNQLYDYKMSHTNALISVLKGEFLIAGAKENIAKKFNSLGLEIIAKSKLLPSFALIVNEKTLTKKEINNIQNQILKISKGQLNGIVKYGAVKSNIKDYKLLNINFKIPKKGNLK